jgi:hypothetical protein
MGELSARDIATTGGSWFGLPLTSLPLNGSGRSDDASGAIGAAFRGC